LIELLEPPSLELLLINADEVISESLNDQEIDDKHEGYRSSDYHNDAIRLRSG
jgi:hypothetical protein